MWSLDEVEGATFVRAIEEGAVEVHDDQDSAWLLENLRVEERLGDVLRRGIGDTAGGSTGDLGDGELVSVAGFAGGCHESGLRRRSGGVGKLVMLVAAERLGDIPGRQVICDMGRSRMLRQSEV